jgi:hypothetical protein
LVLEVGLELAPLHLGVFWVQVLFLAANVVLVVYLL